MLAPELNIWALAQPMIEDWMRESRSPESRLREAAEEWVGRVQRLPQMLDNFEAATKSLVEDGVKVAPDSLQDYNRRQPALRWHVTLLWGAVALVLVILLLD